MASSTTMQINGIRLIFTTGDSPFDGISVLPDEIENKSDREIGAAFRIAAGMFQEYRVYARVQEFVLSGSYEDNGIQYQPRETIGEVRELCYKALELTQFDFNDNERDYILAFARKLGEMLMGRRFSNPKGKKAARPGYVYLLKAVTPDNHYKIGRSKEPKKRIDTLNVKLPYPIDTICVIETHDMYALEKDLHNYFADKRVDGEWFALDDSDVEYIKGLGQ